MKPLYKIIGLAALVLSIPLTVSANNPTKVWEITEVTGGGAAYTNQVYSFNSNAPGASSCFNQFGCYIVEGTYYPTLSLAKEAFIVANQPSLEETFPDNTYEITGINDDGTSIINNATFDYSLPNAENCLNETSCYFAEGAYYTSELLAKTHVEQAIAAAEAAAAAAAAAYEATFPNTVYNVIGFHEGGGVKVQVNNNFDHLAPGAEACSGQVQCLIYNGNYYTYAQQVQDAHEAEIAAAEAAAQAAYEMTDEYKIDQWNELTAGKHPQFVYVVQGFNGTHVSLATVPYTYEYDPEAVCINQLGCYKMPDGTHVNSAFEAVNWYKAKSFESDLAAKIIATAASNAQVRFDQYSDPIETNSFDAVDNFRYQQSATSHRIRLRIADNSYFNDNWSTALKSDTQSLIVGLAQDVFKKGFAEGYETGFKEGYEDGYIEGYDQGYLDYHANK